MLLRCTIIGILCASAAQAETIDVVFDEPTTLLDLRNKRRLAQACR